MNKEIFNYLINELTNELTRGHECQSEFETDDDMFHFYTGYNHALQECIDLICKANSRKEKK